MYVRVCVRARVCVYIYQVRANTTARSKALSTSSVCHTTNLIHAKGLSTIALAPIVIFLIET